MYKTELPPAKPASFIYTKTALRNEVPFFCKI